jgi:hypothetical protein
MKIKLFISLMVMLIFAINGFGIEQDENKSSDKMIELILDASGSMNAQLSSGQLKIDAAKMAVQEVVESLSDDLIIALRCYGHQSPREKKDCRDTQLLVDFDILESNRSKIISSMGGINARGYTPITYVLNLAVKDFPENISSRKTMILISDGKETCEGDPCATAKELKEREDIDLIIHTVGFGVDSVTREQLECISEVTGGQYFSASNTKELIEMLKKAVEAEAVEIKKEEGPGWLSIKGPELQGHTVINAENDEEVATISRSQDAVKLPSGIYNVEIGNTAWKSVEVEAGKTTVLEPGWLKVNNTTLSGHEVLEKETGELFGSVSRTDSTLTILPGEYVVMFGEIPWSVTIEKGKTAALNPGVVKVKSADFSGHYIYDEKGNEIGSVSATGNWIPLPPGEYMIDIDGQEINFSLQEGEEKVFERKHP